MYVCGENEKGERRNREKAINKPRMVADKSLTFVTKSEENIVTK